MTRHRRRSRPEDISPTQQGWIVVAGVVLAAWVALLPLLVLAR